MKGGVDLPLLFLSHLEVTQASFLCTPQLANTKKGSREQSTEVEKALIALQGVLKWPRKPSVLYCVWTEVMDGRGWKGRDKSVKNQWRKNYFEVEHFLLLEVNP